MATHRFSLCCSLLGPCMHQGEHFWSRRLHPAGPTAPLAGAAGTPLPGSGTREIAVVAWALSLRVPAWEGTHTGLGCLTCVLQCSTEASCPQDQVYRPCGEAKRNTCFRRWVISYKAFFKSIMCKLPGKFEVHILLGFRCLDCLGLRFSSVHSHLYSDCAEESLRTPFPPKTAHQCLLKDAIVLMEKFC